ncbi:MAG: hypothetical protein IJ157_00975 [Clostridia bacterium]|nr:hypothetical protein [Clostridia bacterium]
MQTDGISHLSGEPRYENAHCAAAYQRFDITPLGVYAFLKIEPKDAYFDREGEWALTDEKGAPVFGAKEGQIDELYEIYGQYDEAGRRSICCDFQWYGAGEDDLPDTVSLTWMPDDGESVLFPVRVR